MVLSAPLDSVRFSLSAGLFLGARMGTPITVFIIKGNIETMLETVNKIQGTLADK